MSAPRAWGFWRRWGRWRSEVCGVGAAALSQVRVPDARRRLCPCITPCCCITAVVQLAGSGVTWPRTEARAARRRRRQRGAAAVLAVGV